ncbi:hypothetical protein SELMODRAFT_406173 [Selaginella moellendorffii]|uniref:Uncharacterized protein n=1 Tax=Selaginella moellendorffii TaxID=88036 RepID=D8R1H9_SELML|nr:hypothetical protein SELMODRAFT_406173 [Selaginella moellendorffii]
MENIQTSFPDSVSDHMSSSHGNNAGRCASLWQAEEFKSGSFLVTKEVPNPYIHLSIDVYIDMFYKDDKVVEVLAPPPPLLSPSRKYLSLQFKAYQFSFMVNVITHFGNKSFVAL